MEHWPTVLCFTDLQLFLSPYILYSHDTIQTLTYGQDQKGCKLRYMGTHAPDKKGK